MIVKRVVSVFKAGGVVGVLGAIIRRLRMPHARSFPVIRNIARGSTGIEIGGPSPIFSRGGLIPVYPLAQQIDNVNFARATIWEGAITEGDSFRFHPSKAPGRQFIAEGADLRTIPADCYDFVLSSHMLEHTANPLRALCGWGRLLIPGGHLILVLPHRDGTFDHRRPITTLWHLIADRDTQVDENDLTHIPEILELHDLSRDPGVTDVGEFRDRAARNAEIRSMHHHVFDTRLAVAAVTQAGFEPIAVEPLQPYHIIVIAQKPMDPGRLRHGTAVELDAVLRASPFPTDRQ